MTEYQVQPCISESGKVQNENDVWLNQARRAGREAAGTRVPPQTAGFVCRVGSTHMGLSFVSLVSAGCLRSSRVDLCRLSLLFDSNTQPQSRQQTCGTIFF